MTQCMHDPIWVGLSRVSTTRRLYVIFLTFTALKRKKEKEERNGEGEREGKEINEKKGKNGWLGGKERPETRCILSQRDKCGCR